MPKRILAECLNLFLMASCSCSSDLFRTIVFKCIILCSYQNGSLCKCLLNGIQVELYVYICGYREITMVFILYLSLEMYITIHVLLNEYKKSSTKIEHFQGWFYIFFGLG